MKNIIKQIIKEELQKLNEKCWKGYTQKGMKTMFGKKYPNCVKLKEQITKTKIICDKCGWSWNINDGGKDLYICKCGHDNNPNLLNGKFIK